MAKTVDLQAVVKHIVDGSFTDSLCRLCLLPLGECYENIFTKVCKEEQEYCVADILNKVCQVKISSSEKYNVCSDCFFEASSAYKFYLLSQRTEEILTYYINELHQHIRSINIPEECSSDSICIKMPLLVPPTELFDYDLSGLCIKNNKREFEDLKNDTVSNVKVKVEPTHKDENKPIAKIGINVEPVKAQTVKREAEELEHNEDEDDEEIVIVMAENGEPSFFKSNAEGSFVSLSEEEAKSYCEKFKQSNSKESQSQEVNEKRRRKRNPMDYKKCSQCPIRYRFVAKLKEHMKADHNIDIFVCKVCKAIIENEDEFNKHLQTHTNIHRCSICNAVFKKRDSIIAHFKSHEVSRELSNTQGAHVCEICGWILKDEASLKDHHQNKHVKKYTCYYCGRMYKGEISFDIHIKKHEAHINLKQKRNSTCGASEPLKEKKNRHKCNTCARSFVDERALMWHERLHRDERPYVCEVCGRAFVSVNRRNQHALCAHTAPARRCPLCPALFHLRSMVNSHIKKVHLQTHKRRNRANKHQNVFWRTEPVPFQELSVAVQSDILELRTRDRERPAPTRRYELPATLEIKEEGAFLQSCTAVNVLSSGNSVASLVNYIPSEFS